MNEYLVEIIIGKTYDTFGNLTGYITQKEKIHATSMSNAYKNYENHEVQITKISGGSK